MIKKMYGKAVIVEEINKIISESITKYIDENKIGILGQPLPNLEKNTPFNFEEETDFEFYFDLGLAPEIEIDVNDEIEVVYYDIKVEKEMIDNYISEAMKRMGETIIPDESDEGDVLEGEIVELNQDGDVLEGGIKNETSIAIDLIKDKTIQKKLIGLKKDDTLIFNPLKATESEVETATMLGIKKEEVEKNTSDFQCGGFLADSTRRDSVDQQLLHCRGSGPVWLDSLSTAEPHDPGGGSGGVDPQCAVAWRQFHIWRHQLHRHRAQVAAARAETDAAAYVLLGHAWHQHPGGALNARAGRHIDPAEL